MIFRNNRKVVFVEEIAGIWTIVARKMLPKNNVVKFRKQAFLVPPNNPAYVSRRYITYILTTTGKPLSFYKLDLEQQGELVEDIFCKQIVRQWVTAASTSPLSLATVLYVILGVVAGIPAGMILGPFVGINIGG